jgi:hypothetical protein
MKIRKPIIHVFIILGLVLLAVAPQAAYGNFRIVVLPDTQNYSQFYPTIYTAQTQWITDNKDTLNIVFTAHVGDVVNTCTSSTQYDNADASMDVLDGGNVPYGVSPGNHDQANSGTCGSTSNYPAYFGTSRFSAKSYYGGSSGDYNSYFLFSAGGMDFIIIFLQYAPGTTQLNWADARLKDYPARRGIIVSHSILNVGGTQTSWTAEGQSIFNALSDNPNLFLMLCGHNHGEGRRTDTGTNGNTIYSLLADYQNDANGGNGFLRILEFNPSADQINVTTYSPYTGGSGTAFTLSYNMPTSLYGDVAPTDCDVDGTDLAGWIATGAPTGMDLEAFAGNFGRNACQ